MLRIFQRFTGVSVVPTVEAPAVIPAPAKAPARARAARQKHKWVSSYRPPSFGSHARMSKGEVEKMDAAYRAEFGDDRGGQKLQRDGLYNPGILVAEFNVA